MFVQYVAFASPIVHKWENLTSNTNYTYFFVATNLDIVNGITSNLTNNFFSTLRTIEIEKMSNTIKNNQCNSYYIEFLIILPLFCSSIVVIVIGIFIIYLLYKKNKKLSF